MKKDEKQFKCEGCNEQHSEVVKNVLQTNQATYILCSNCLCELVATSLPPEHFNNLINNGHTTSEFLLHGDFYDNVGTALQPKE